MNTSVDIEVLNFEEIHWYKKKYKKCHTPREYFKWIYDSTATVWFLSLCWRNATCTKSNRYFCNLSFFLFLYHKTFLVWQKTYNKTFSSIFGRSVNSLLKNCSVEMLEGGLFKKMLIICRDNIVNHSWQKKKKMLISLLLPFSQWKLWFLGLKSVGFIKRIFTSQKCSLFKIDRVGHRIACTDITRQFFWNFYFFF